MDARIMRAYRHSARPSRRWLFFVAPVPALAALLLLMFHPRPIPPPARADAGYVTRLDASGFQPLPNGDARIVRAGDIRQ
jgi:hypothetical protein